MKYQSELIKEMIDSRGHEKSSIHYQSECVETWIEEAKGAYPKLCDYESEWLNYIVQNPIGEFPYEAVSTNTTATVNRVVPYAYKSAILKGQTLVNLATTNTQSLTQGNVVENGVFTVYGLGTNKYSSAYIEKLNTLKESTTYTVITFVYENTLTNEYVFTTAQTQSQFNTKFAIPGGTVGVLKVKLTTKDSFDGTLCSLRSYSFNSDGYIKYSIIILEGDYTNVDIPYFEGMQSVKMPVLTTTGKNLFNGELENGAIVSSTGVNTPSANNVRSVGYIKVKPNTSFVLSNNLNYSNNFIYEYDSNKNYIGRKTTNPFTTSTNCHYIRFRSDTNQPNLDVKYQIEYGTQATSYEPYKTNILSCNEDVTLRGIGVGSNRVEDELDCLTGKVTERIREVTLNGSEEWSINNSNNEGFFSCSTTTYVGVPNGKIICDKLPSVKSTKTEGVMMGVTTGKLIVSFNRDKSGVTSLSSFKEKLAQLQLKVCYEIENVDKTVDLTVTDQDGNTLSTIKPIEGTMHITPTGEPIAPTAVLEIPVEAVTQNLASFIEEE